MSAEITEWIDPSGTLTTLDVDWDATGRFMPDIAHEEDGVPGQPGSRHRASRHKAHEFTIKLNVTASTEPALRTAMRQIVYAMDPTRGEGTIRVTSPLGDVREILCYYTAGLGMEEKFGSSGPTMQQCAVMFRAYDPYWRDTTSSTQAFTIGATPSFFPIFPIRLTSSSIAVDATVINTGDVATWPVWTIVGPGAAIILRNLNTGEYISFDTLALGSGESVVIDTRPGYKTVTKSDDTNLFPDLSILSTLWALQPGNTAVRLEMSAAIAGSSSMNLSYKRKYLSP